MKVLVCPLNWGLGHATRLLPVIELCLQNNYNVFIAGNGFSLAYLKKEFPKQKFIHISGYNMKYSKRESQTLPVFLKVPSIVYYSIKEHIVLKRIIRKYKIDVVISDNRYGLWNKKVYSIFITHQLRVKFPGFLSSLEPLYQKLQNFIINKYNECWIPDFEGEKNLSGELSHILNLPLNACFIGPISHLSNKDNLKNKAYIYQVLFILSGPESQRTILENIIFEQTKNKKIKCAIVRGTENGCENKFSFPVFDILNTKSLADLIINSEMVICRSGYSSVMDLVLLNKKAVLIPTPGQPEQEYLARYLNEKKLFYTVNQKNFNLNEALINAYNQNIFFKEDKNILEKKIMNLKNIQNKKRNKNTC